MLNVISKSLKKYNIGLLYDPTIPFLVIPKRIESRDLNRYMYTHVHSRLFTIAKM